MMAAESVAAQMQAIRESPRPSRCKRDVKTKGFSEKTPARLLSVKDKRANCRREMQFLTASRKTANSGKYCGKSAFRDLKTQRLAASDVKSRQRGRYNRILVNAREIRNVIVYCVKYLVSCIYKNTI